MIGLLRFYFFSLFIDFFLLTFVLLLKLELAMVVSELDMFVNSRASGWLDQRHRRC